jgi:hypothetical protein
VIAEGRRLTREDVTMTPPAPSIFRPEALEYRLQNRDRRSAAVRFPGLMARPALVLLWIALAVGIAAGTGAFFGTVPQGISAIAVPASEPGRVAVIVPIGGFGDVEAGQVTTLTLGAKEIHGTVVAVETELANGTALGARLGLPVSMQGEFGLAWVAVDAVDPAAPGSSVGWAMIETGERRAGSYLPLVGSWFGE